MRGVVLAAGLGFCLIFGFMTLAVAFQSSFDLFTLAALIIVGLIVVGLIGAMRNPPEE